MVAGYGTPSCERSADSPEWASNPSQRHWIDTPHDVVGQPAGGVARLGDDDVRAFRQTTRMC